MLAEVDAFSSNALITSSVPRQLGEAVAGVLPAAYNGSIRAHLDVWRPADLTDWQLSPPDAVYRTNLADFASWAAARLPILGGYPYAEDAPGGNRMWGDRNKPPIDGPHLFHRDRRRGGLMRPKNAR